MATRRLVMAVTVALTAALGGMAWGDLTPEQANEAQTLLGQLTSPEFKVRQEANRRLVAMDDAVVPVVRATMAQAKDDDARLRCQMVIDTILAPNWLSTAADGFLGYVAKQDYGSASTLLAQSLDTLIREPMRNNANKKDLATAVAKVWRGEVGGDTRRARDCIEAGYERALRLEPEDIEVHGVLVDFYAQDGNVEKGNAVLLKGLARFQGDPSWCLGGLPGETGGGKIRTIEGCQAAVQRNAGDLVSRLRLIKLLERAGKLEEGAEQYTQLVPGVQDSAVRFRLFSLQAELYEKANKFSEAVAAYDKAAGEKAPPKDQASLLYREARVKWRLKDMDGVITTWEKAIALHPDVEAACRWRMALAQFCVEQGQGDKALTLCDEVLKLSKDPATRKMAEDMRQGAGK